MKDRDSNRKESEPIRAALTPPETMIPIIDETPDLLVLHKPPGLAFHRQGETPGLFDRVRRQQPGVPLFAVHRLDRITSGLLLVAKNRETASDLGSLFQQGRVEKYYLAVSDRKPKKKQGTVCGDMARSRRGTWKILRSSTRPALTEFKSTVLAPGLRLFLLRPHTGRTHQLRVALKSIGSPILGDPRYHPTPPSDQNPDRGYLHCYALAFELAGRCYRYHLRPATWVHFTSAAFRDAVQAYLMPRDLCWSHKNG